MGAPNHTESHNHPVPQDVVMAAITRQNECRWVARLPLSLDKARLYGSGAPAGCVLHVTLREWKRFFFQLLSLLDSRRLDLSSRACWRIIIFTICLCKPVRRKAAGCIHLPQHVIGFKCTELFPVKMSERFYYKKNG